MNCLGIPKRIHQIWFNFEFWGWVKPPPQRLTGARMTWVDQNPDWQVQLWNENSADNLLETHYPDWWDKFMSFKEPIQRADFFRWVVLYHFGGCYADMDTECVEPLNKRIQQWCPPGYPIVCHTAAKTSVTPIGCPIMAQTKTHEKQPGEKQQHVLLIPPGGGAMNALLITTPKNPAVKFILDSMKPTVMGNSVLGIFYSTGPMFLKWAAAEIRSKRLSKLILDPTLLEHLPDQHHQRDYNKKSFAIHHGDGSWDYQSAFQGDIIRIVVAILLIVLLLVLCLKFSTR